MITRQKPATAPDEAWEEFNELADEQALGDEDEDWSVYWDFFYHGWCARGTEQTLAPLLEETDDAEDRKEPRTSSRRRRPASMGSRKGKAKSKKKGDGKRKQKKKSR